MNDRYPTILQQVQRQYFGLAQVPCTPASFARYFLYEHLDAQPVWD